MDTRGVILIPTSNRLESLERTLTFLGQCNSIERVDEVLIINNGDKEQSEAIENLLHDKLTSAKTAVVHEPRTGLSKALNRGLDYLADNHPKDRLLIRFDDDVDLGVDTLSTLFNAHTRWNGHAIFGMRITPLLPDNVASGSCTYLKGLMRPFYAQYDFGENEKEVRMAPFGPALALPLGLMGAERFDETLGYPKYYGEETEWLQRVKDHTSSPFVYLPDAVVMHRIRPDQLEHEWRLKRCQIAGATLAKVDSIRGQDERLLKRNARRRRRRILKSRARELFWLSLRRRDRARYWTYKGAIHRSYLSELAETE